MKAIRLNHLTAIGISLGFGGFAAAFYTAWGTAVTGAGAFILATFLALILTLPEPRGLEQ